MFAPKWQDADVRDAASVLVKSCPIAEPGTTNMRTAAWASEALTMSSAKKSVKASGAVKPVRDVAQDAVIATSVVVSYAVCLRCHDASTGAPLYVSPNGPGGLPFRIRAVLVKNSLKAGVRVNDVLRMAGGYAVVAAGADCSVDTTRRSALVGLLSSVEPCVATPAADETTGAALPTVVYKVATTSPLDLHTVHTPVYAGIAIRFDAACGGEYGLQGSCGDALANSLDNARGVITLAPHGFRPPSTVAGTVKPQPKPKRKPKRKPTASSTGKKPHGHTTVEAVAENLNKEADAEQPPGPRFVDGVITTSTTAARPVPWDDGARVLFRCSELLVTFLVQTVAGDVMSRALSASMAAVQVTTVTVRDRSVAIPTTRPDLPAVMQSDGRASIAAVVRPILELGGTVAAMVQRALLRCFLEYRRNHQAGWMGKPLKVAAVQMCDVLKLPAEWKAHLLVSLSRFDVATALSSERTVWPRQALEWQLETVRGVAPVERFYVTYRVPHLFHEYNQMLNGSAADPQL